MLTLHVEGATVAELVQNTLAALGIDGNAAITTDVTRAAVAESITPEEPARRRKTKGRPEPEITPADLPQPSIVEFPTPKGDAGTGHEPLRKQFEALVERNYEGALSILDTLGVANFKEAVTKGMAPQIKLAMEAFA